MTYRNKRVSRRKTRFVGYGHGMSRQVAPAPPGRPAWGPGGLGVVEDGAGAGGEPRAPAPTGPPPAAAAAPAPAFDINLYGETDRATDARQTALVAGIAGAAALPAFAAVAPAAAPLLGLAAAAVAATTAGVTIADRISEAREINENLDEQINAAIVEQNRIAGVLSEAIAFGNQYYLNNTDETARVIPNQIIATFRDDFNDITSSLSRSSLFTPSARRRRLEEYTEALQELAVLEQEIINFMDTYRRRN